MHMYRVVPQMIRGNRYKISIRYCSLHIWNKSFNMTSMCRFSKVEEFICRCYKKKDKTSLTISLPLSLLF